MATADEGDVAARLALSLREAGARAPLTAEASNWKFPSVTELAGLYATRFNQITEAANAGQESNSGTKQLGLARSGVTAIEVSTEVAGAYSRAAAFMMAGLETKFGALTLEQRLNVIGDVGTLAAVLTGIGLEKQAAQVLEYQEKLTQQLAVKVVGRV